MNETATCYDQPLPKKRPRTPAGTCSPSFSDQRVSEGGGGPRARPVASERPSAKRSTALSIVISLARGVKRAPNASADADRRPRANAETSADQRQKAALRQRLPHDAPAARAERGSEGHLSRAPQLARERQVGDVPQAEEHEADHGEKDHERRSGAQ